MKRIAISLALVSSLLSLSVPGLAQTVLIEKTDVTEQTYNSLFESSLESKKSLDLETRNSMLDRYDLDSYLTEEYCPNCMDLMIPPTNFGAFQGILSPNPRFDEYVESLEKNNKCNFIQVLDLIGLDSRIIGYFQYDEEQVQEYKKNKPLDCTERIIYMQKIIEQIENI